METISFLPEGGWGRGAEKDPENQELWDCVHRIMDYEPPNHLSLS